MNINGTKLCLCSKVPGKTNGKGMKEFSDKGREATKQELYENLLGMDNVTIVKPKKLETELCINALTYLMFLK